MFSRGNKAILTITALIFLSFDILLAQNDHPRLYFTLNEIPDIKAKKDASQTTKEVYDLLVVDCERYVKKHNPPDWHELKKDIDARHFGKYVQEASLGYLLTNNKRYRDVA